MKDKMNTPIHARSIMQLRRVLTLYNIYMDRQNIWYFQALSLVNRSPSLFIRCTQPTIRLETFSVGWFAGNNFVGRFLFWKISKVDDWFKLPASWRYAYHCQFAGNLLDDFGKFRLCCIHPSRRFWGSACLKDLPDKPTWFEMIDFILCVFFILYNKLLFLCDSICLSMLYVIKLEYLCLQLNLKFKSFWNPNFSLLKYIRSCPHVKLFLS